MLCTQMPLWRISTMDLCMAVFIYTSYYADNHAGLSTASTFDLFNNLTVVLVPYMAGKLLIEQPGARIATVKRLVFLLFVASVIGAYEYRMGQNPFTLMWARFFPGEVFAWKTQIRWGWGRVSGPFAQSELAGIILLFGTILALYLSYFKFWEQKFSWFPKLPGSKAKIISWVVGLTLLMTQARGPWIGFLFALPIALIGRSKRILRSAILAACFLGIVGPTVYVGLKQYVSDAAGSNSAEKESAAYRSQMIDGYVPVAEEGGLMGWGQHFPHLLGMDSIDNEYLYIALTQGMLGLAMFCLIAVQAFLNFGHAAIFSRTREDRAFGWSMTGIFAGMLFVIFTVFLGNQPQQLFFLLAGWSQALRLDFPQKHLRPGALEEEADATASRKSKFVFENVYT